MLYREVNVKGKILKKSKMINTKIGVTVFSEGGRAGKGPQRQ